MVASGTGHVLQTRQIAGKVWAAQQAEAENNNDMERGERRETWPMEPSPLDVDNTPVANIDKMAFIYLPAELLDSVLEFIIPQDWNRSGDEISFLELRLVSKRFGAIVSQHAFRKLYPDRRAMRVKRDTFKWLLATKVNMVGRTCKGPLEGIYLSVWAIISWKACNTEAACWQEYLNSACSLMIANQDRRWLLRQMRASSSRPLDSWRPETESCNGWGSQPSLTRQEALTSMMRFQSLQVAAYHGDRPIVEALLRCGVDPNAWSRCYGTALYAAAYGGRTDIVRLLVDWGANLRCKGYMGNLLEAAALGGHVDIMELLLDEGVNMKESGKALLYASEGGHELAVQLLLARADIGDFQRQDSDGQTALLLAARNAHKKTVATLLLRWVDTPDQAVLWWALKWGWDDIVQHLITKTDVMEGTNVRYFLMWSVTEGNDRMLSHFLQRYRVQVDEHGHDNYLGSLLSCALDQGHEAVVRLLLSRNDVNPIQIGH